MAFAKFFSLVTILFVIGEFERMTEGTILPTKNSTIINY
jgi:hypothetical protein